MSTKKITKNSLIAGGMLTVLLAGGAIVATTSVSAAENEETDTTNSRFGGAGGFAQMAKRINPEIVEAIESGDYEAWKQAVSENPRGEDITSIITEENFNQFVEMHELRQNGEYEEADAIREKLGLPSKEEMEAKREERREEMEQNREELNTTLENKDYEAWKSLISETPRGEDLLAAIDTEEDFLKLVEAHEYMETGAENREKAREIMKELGLERPMGQGQGGERGSKENSGQRSGRQGRNSQKPF